MKLIDSLRAILELEHNKGYSNKAVIGGLDKYFHNKVGQIRQDIGNRQLLAEFDKLNLANSNYGSLDINARSKWITHIFDWLDKFEQAKKDTFTSSLPLKERNRKSATTSHPSPHLAMNTRVTEMAKPYQEGKSAALDSPITIIKGITPRVATKFTKLNIRTIHDFLYLLPRRYVDYSQRKHISELEVGQEQTIIATVWQARVATFGYRPGTEAIVADETGNIRVIWFNQPYLARRFPTNSRVVISGMVYQFKGLKVFESPEWEMLEDKELIHTARLVPVYPLTQGLYPRQVRKWTKEAIDRWAWQVGDFLPSEVKNRCQLLNLPEAVAQIHYPDDQLMAVEAVRRLAFDELLLLQLSLLSRKRDWQQSQPGNAFNVDRNIIDMYLHCLPFTLTRAQERVLEEILADLTQPTAMSRLLQGEVGSGKTVIAVLALLIAVANNYQGALMAPTEVLAEQHFNNICGYLSQAITHPLPGEVRPAGEPPPCQEEKTDNIRYYTGLISHPLTIALLVGSLSDSEKEELHHKIRQGKIDIVIGTHTLIQKGVSFHKLGLAVIDEQQRFGVLQRSSLRQKGFNPHVLVMTATPIPRTMALTLYGDLDLSIIDEMPPGRQQVKTIYIEPQHTEKAYNFIRRQAISGRQAFIICPLIEESEILEVKAATTEYTYLSQEIFPDLRLGLLHGRMPPGDKEKVMRSFREGALDILVSTSVIEVGIDIPNATVMMVEGADRFGLSQLHQFRGRVGRDKEQGYCILIPEKSSPETDKRLQLMEKFHNGLALAEKDLELRGPGEFFGTHQSGLPDLKIAKLSDLHLLELARQEAITLFQGDTNLEQPEHQPLRDRLSQVWSKDTEWS